MSQEARYVLCGGPLAGTVIDWRPQAEYVDVPVRTGRLRWSEVMGRYQPEFDMARYRLSGMVGEYVENAYG